MEQFGMAAVTILVGVFGCVTYFYLSNVLLDRIYPASGPRAGANINAANRIRPWLFLLPALLLLTVYLVYPVFVSVYLSFMDATGENFVGADNYIWLINDGKFRESMVNNLLWLVFVPAASTFFGLAAAAVTDRIRWGNFAKAMIFMPMAISFVGAAVIWKLVYEYRPAGQEQIGILNADAVNTFRLQRGVRAWGARTASSDPQWRYIPIRRLFIMLRRSIEAGYAWMESELLGAHLRHN